MARLMWVRTVAGLRLRRPEELAHLTRLRLSPAHTPPPCYAPSSSSPTTTPPADKRSTPLPTRHHYQHEHPSPTHTTTPTSHFKLGRSQWRLRYLPRDGAAEQTRAELTSGVSWVESVYEPETHAFGGPQSMTAAHTLWHADSRAILTHLTTGAGHRRELSLLLCTAMMRAADLDFYEQGDVWAKVADHRPAHPESLPDPRTWDTFTQQVRQTITGTAAPPGPHKAWTKPFTDAGTALLSMNDSGTLTRGIRHIVAHHVLFHWNRIGLASQTQAALATAARNAVFSDKGRRPFRSTI